MTTQHRTIDTLAVIEPETAQTILEPEHRAAEYWIGAPSVLYEPELDRFLMTYRERRPRGAQAERGWRCAIAESPDGISYHDVWEVHKDELGTSSMERFSLLPDSDGGYLLYLSYVDPADNRWRIDVLSAETPDEFKPRDAVAAVTAESTGTEGLKDPYTVSVDGQVYLYASCARRGKRDAAWRDAAHASADIYATGMTDHPTGLAVSSDGLGFQWHPDALRLGTHWDRWSTRLTTVLPAGDGYVAMYDGAASADENYQERTGFATSADLRTWTRVTNEAPVLTSRHGTRSLRYADVAPVGDEWFVYFEYAMPDGSHELRLSRIDRSPSTSGDTHTT